MVETVVLATNSCSPTNRSVISKTSFVSIVAPVQSFHWHEKLRRHDCEALNDPVTELNRKLQILRHRRMITHVHW